MTFIFYDTETTGLNPAFDQVVQFAAIVTDDEFNILDEKDLRCRLRPHVIPSPGAMRTTKVGPKVIQSAPLSCYEMTCQIRAFIEHWSPAVLIGFNSIKFDEGMLRQLFFQALHPIYLTNTNGNSRMDVMRLAHAVAAHQPDALVIPLNEKGKPSFKLGDLVRANGVALDNAHDALADTRATLELAKFLKFRAPMVWQDLHACRSRHTMDALLAEHDLFLYTDRAFKRPTILAGRVAAHPNNPAAVAVFDLEYDPEIYLDAEQTEIQRLLKASPRPLRIMKTNALPIVVPLRSEMIGQFDAEQALKRFERIQRHQTFSKVVTAAMGAQDEDLEQPQHVEQTIYSGFPSRNDRKLMDEFHLVPWLDKHALLDRFEDRRFKELGERIIYSEFPDGLPLERFSAMKSWHLQRHKTKEEVPWLTLSKGMSELEEAKPEFEIGHPALFREIEEYFTELAAHSDRNPRA